jgi:hypothetical protein
VIALVVTCDAPGCGAAELVAGGATLEPAIARRGVGGRPESLFDVGVVAPSPPGWRVTESGDLCPKHA